MAEVAWVDIPGYEDCYMVSSIGTIRAKDRIIVLKSGTKRRLKGRNIVPKKNGLGYSFVGLSKEGRTSNHYVHRLVASAFLHRAPGQCEVNHKDGNKANNSLENLEWVTHAANVQHAYKNNLSMNKGKGHFMATGVIDNELGLEFGSIKEWAEARGINYSTGRNLLSGYSTKKGINMSLIVKLKIRKNGPNR